MYFSAQQSGITVFSVHKLTAFAFILVLWIWKIEPRNWALDCLDLGDRSLKTGIDQTMDLGDRSLKSGVGPWISGIDPWNLPLYPGFGGMILEIRLGAMDFGDRSLKFSLTLDLGDRSLKSGLGPWIWWIDPWNLPLPWIWGNDPWNQAWGHGFRGSILEIYPYPGFGGTILEIRLGAMDFGDRSLKFSLTLDLGDRSLKSGLGPWISGIDPWNFPLPWIWWSDPWNQAWGHGFRGSILEIYPYPGFGGTILEIRLGAMDSGIDPWNFPLPWIWGIDPWNQAWGHGFRGSILEIYPYPGFGGIDPWNSLKSGLGPWISGIHPWNLPLPWIWGIDPWNSGLEPWISGIDPWNLPLPWIWGIDPWNSLKSGLGPWIWGIDPWNLLLPWISGNDPWNQAWGHGFRGSILEIYPYPGCGGPILEIRLGAMDFGDRSLKFTLIPWIWWSDPWNQAWGHGFQGSILEIYPYPGFGGSILEIRLGPWISGIDPWNLPLSWIWGIDPWNQAYSGLGPWIWGIEPWNFPWIWGIDPWN